MTTSAEARHLRWAGALAVLAVAVALRLIAPSPFVTWDEPTWTYRSLRFLRALEAGRPAETVQSAHPGVLTMWAGAAGVRIAAATRSEGAADLAWVDDLPPFDEDDTALLERLWPWWPPARAAIAVLTGLLVVGAYLLATRLFPLPSAMAAGMLLAFDPYLLAHSRVLHLDAVLALTWSCSILATLVFLTHRGGRRYLLLGGAMAGLAVVEKSPGAAIVPATMLLTAAATIRDRGASRAAAIDTVRVLAWWGVAAALAYTIAWPALWAAPVATLARMADYARRSAGGPREAVFFAGHVQRDPGIALYLAAVAYRLTPLAVLGLVAALPAVRRSDSASRRSVLGLLACAAVYAVAMGLGAKKFERYILPAVPPLLVVAGHGAAWLAAAGAAAVERVAGPRLPAVRGRSGRIAAGLLAVALLAQGAAVAARGPHYLAVYNPLLGGGEVAARVLPVGWGEGMDHAAAYLNALPEAALLIVATPSVTLLAPFFEGTTVGAGRWSEADYAVLYVDDVQIRRPDLVDRLEAEHEPVHVVYLGGIAYAWIYDLSRPPDN